MYTARNRFTRKKNARPTRFSFSYIRLIIYYVRFIVPFSTVWVRACTMRAYAMKNKTHRESSWLRVLHLIRVQVRIWIKNLQNDEMYIFDDNSFIHALHGQIILSNNCQNLTNTWGAFENLFTRTSRLNVHLFLIIINQMLRVILG